MADEVDIAQQQNERAIEAALQYRKPVTKIAPVGECYWCGEIFEEGSLKLFCDSNCAKGYERMKP